ncbi:MAG: sulfurtransferase, partial [Deltaproteobacteria bacterium]|nr:sulfurtransferase [Deltaproteobacteria bacterium]
MKRTKYVGPAAIVLIAWMAFALTSTAGAEVVYPKLLIKAEVLAESLEAPNLRIVDCRRKVEDYQMGHIPGAVFLNVFGKLRTTSPSGVIGVRRMLEEQEEVFGRTLGITSETMVVLYDDTGWDATRLFWELSYAGHEKVAILYGGWPEWQKKGLPVSTETPGIKPQVFISRPNPEILATTGYVLANLSNPKVALLDCRPPEQFVGTKKHPKAAVAGRIPGAVNVFTLTNWENKTYL